MGLIMSQSGGVLTNTDGMSPVSTEDGTTCKGWQTKIICRESPKLPEWLQAWFADRALVCAGSVAR